MVAQLYRRGLVSTYVEAVDNAAPVVMDDDDDATTVDSRHLVAATNSWQIIDDEVETAIRLHALASATGSTKHDGSSTGFRYFSWPSRLGDSR